MDWIASEESRLLDDYGQDAAPVSLLKVFRAIKRSSYNGEISSADAAVLLEGMADPSESIWGRTIQYVIRLGNRLPESHDVLRQAAQSKEWRSRFNLCAGMIGREFPETLAFELIPRLSRDKSAKVRKKVADVCLRRGWSNMVPVLDGMSIQERNAEMRRSIKFAIGLLRDGKYDTGKNIVYRYPDGTVSSKPPSN